MDNQKLTKKERYLLKKQRKEQERIRLIRRKKIKKILFISLPILLSAGIIIFFTKNYTPEEKHPGTPAMEIPVKEYDAGTISMSDGNIKHSYEIKNNGVGDLEIKDIKTSCMCTTAILKVRDKKSPEFGMHNNPVFWSEKIYPGETGILEVTFDPAFHGPQGTGDIVRIVSFLTNDPQNEKAEIRLLANVTK